MTDAANVIWLDGARAEGDGVPVAEVLAKAQEACEEVLVIGYLKGNPAQIYAAASFPGQTAPQSLWLMELCKAWMLKGCPEQEG